MPVISIGGELFFLGSQVDFNTVKLYATFYAASLRHSQFQLQGNPPIFFPNNPSDAEIDLYLRDYYFAFQYLVSVLES